MVIKLVTVAGEVMKVPATVLALVEEAEMELVV